MRPHSSQPNSPALRSRRGCIAGWPRSEARNSANAQMADAAMVFRRAVPNDWGLVKGLLESCSLPIDGAQQHLGDFLLAFEGDALSACGGLECDGGGRRLRSGVFVSSPRGP